MNSIYLVTMERYGDREGHHYTIGAYSDLGVATIEALSHELYRANKYEFRIEILEINTHDVKEIPREVAINFAKLKFPEKFDDKNNLIEVS